MLLDRFESLGDNCEFGFFQRAMGFEEGSFFRWTMIHDFARLITLIRTDFANLFRLENLVPCAPDSVVDDGCGLIFHTGMRHRQDPASGVWTFDGSDEDRAALYEIERSKINYLVDKFRRSARSGTKTYVIKKNFAPPYAHLIPLLNALNVHGDARILMVCPANRHAAAGSVHRIGDKLYTGYVSRLAAYERADDICVESWRTMIEQAHALIDAHHPHDDRSSSLLEAHDATPFSELAYLKRYADVASAVAAGVFPDGRAHYDAHGRAEGRLPCL